MGITDKVTGRIKQAAGDLAGSDSLRREGKDEERKADAKEELAREQNRAEEREARADKAAQDADARAEAAAQREYEKADAQVEREEAAADAERERADAKAQEVADLERRT